VDSVTLWIQDPARRPQGQRGHPPHKLARMVYRLLQFGEAYVECGDQAYEQHFKNRLLRNLQKQATHLGYHLIPQTEPAS
jgi:hypothetical protein